MTMSENPTRNAGKTNQRAPHTDKKSVPAGTDFTKRSSPLPKPPTTSVANHNPNPKEKRAD